MMTSARQAPEPWKSTAATMFNPYLNLSQMSNAVHHRPIRTQTLTPTRHSRAPPESLVTAPHKDNVPATQSARVKSTVPSANAAEDVAIYVQQMIHSQFCGRSGTPSDMRYDDAKLRRNVRTPSTKGSTTKRITSSKQQHPHEVSECSLNAFFNTADEQMTRVASMMPGRESSFSEMHSARRENTDNRRPASEGLTLGAMCYIASNIGDKMSQSKEKVGLEAIRGFRLPSAKLTYEPYEHHPMSAPLVLGQPQPSEPVRLSDILTDDNFTPQPMIEITDRKTPTSSRVGRSLLKSSVSLGTKPSEWKDWRGKVTQGNLPDVRGRLRRQQSATAISPQRPCTAASNFSKSRPESGAVPIGILEKEDTSPPPPINIASAPASSMMKNGSRNKQRQRTYPLNVRIGETLVRPVSNEHESDNQTPRAISVESTDTAADPPELSVPPNDASRSASGDHLIGELIPRPTPDPQIDPNIHATATTSTPFTLYSSDSRAHHEPSPDPPSNKRRYTLVKSSSRQVYRTVTPAVAVEAEMNSPTSSTEQFSQLTLSQLELLEQYDPAISAKIGVPFIPLQMLARPRDAHLSAGRTIDELHRNYPQRNGQLVFEAPTHRSCHNIIDITQTLQLTKSKRVPVERQTTFERHDDEASIEQILHIVPYENPNRLAVSLVSPLQQHLLVQHTNSTRASSKAFPAHYDDLSMSAQYMNQLKEDGRTELLENRLSVLNIRTKQEVDQTRPKSSSTQKRTIYPTSIVTNLTQRRPPANRNVKQQGRPIASVFLTQDPDEVNYATSIYRQARNEADVTRAFKGFVVQNIQKKLSAEERQRREEQQKAAIRIQRAYRDHLKRRQNIEFRRPATAERHQQERDHRRILSAKRAQHVDQQLTEQTRIRDENKQYQSMIEETGPSLRIFRSFNKIDAHFTKSTLNRAATCIQRWWRGFIIRHRWNYLKREVAASGISWIDFARRYRQVIQGVQTMRNVEKTQFIFVLHQARDFLVYEKKLTAIYDALAFNGKLDASELEKLFEYCDLSATPYEIKEALKAVLKYHSLGENEPLTKALAFDVIYFVFPPSATGVPSSRKSTWVRPIIDGLDESDIRGTSFLEPTDMNVVYKFLAKQ